MRQEDRLGLILQQLNESGSVGVAELADAAGRLRGLRTPRPAPARAAEAAHPDARRRGRLRRALRAADALPRRPAPRRQARDRRSGRRRWSTPEVTSVGLNGGTTTTEVARALSGRARPAGGHQRAQHRLRARRPLQHRAGRVRRQRPRRVLRAGRPARRADPRPTSTSTSRSSASTAISPTAGLTTHHEVEAQTNRALVRAAARVIVVADSSKIGRRGFAKIGDIDAGVRHRHGRGGADPRTSPSSSAPGSRCTSSTRPDAAGPAQSGSGARSASGSSVAVGGDHRVGEVPDRARPTSVAAVLGSTISACRTSSGRSSTAARTVRSTTDRKCRFSAAHCGGQRADGERAGAVGVDARTAPRRRRPAGRLSIEPAVGDRHLDRARRAGDHAVDDLRRVLGRLLLGLDVLARGRPARLERARSRRRCRR